jgi:hypothetical protein
MNARAVQLINHEPDDLLRILSHHPNAVALAKTTNELIFGPGKLKALVLNPQNCRHISAYHPSDMG